MEVKFSKYHGLGNDFFIGKFIEGIDYSSLAKSICDRHIGIGADGIILAKNTKPCEMVFYNADGSRGTMCGNGIRCLSKFILDNKIDELNENNELVIDTLSGIRTVKVIDDLYLVNMGKASFNPEDCGIKGYKTFDKEKLEYKGRTFECSSVFMTTDHVVVLVDDYNISDEEAKFLCLNPVFTKAGINVNFVKIIDSKNIMIRTYERGVGWTKACGSGSTASFAYLFSKGIVEKKINVHLELGDLEISQDELGNCIMAGPAALITDDIKYNFKGE